METALQPVVFAMALTPAPMEMREAIERGDEQRVRELVGRERAMVDRAVTNMNFTPLNFALHASVRQDQLARVLLQLGADPNISASNGLAPLSSAARAGWVDICAELLRKGAKVDHQAASGWTALMIAACYGQWRIVQLLVDYGAEVDLANEQSSFNALMVGSQHVYVRDHIPVYTASDLLKGIQILYAAGASLSKRTTKPDTEEGGPAAGVTAHEIAQHWEMTEAVEFYEFVEESEMARMLMNHGRASRAVVVTFFNEGLRTRQDCLGLDDAQLAKLGLQDARGRAKLLAKLDDRPYKPRFSRLSKRLSRVLGLRSSGAGASGGAVELQSAGLGWFAPQRQRSDQVVPGRAAVAFAELLDQNEGDQEEESTLGRILSHGIRLALTQDNLQPRRGILKSDFAQQVVHQPYLELQNGKGVQYRFTDWSPVVFRNFRETQSIPYEEFLDSLGSQPLRGGRTGSGKSGAIFFKSADGKYVIKELKRSERDTLLRILQSMVQYMTAYPFTFLPRFVGLYSVDPINDAVPQSMSIVVMTNVLDFPRKTQGDSNLLFNEVYDLKGSVHNRFTSSPQQRSLSQTGSAGRMLSRKMSADAMTTPLRTPQANSQKLHRTNSSPPAASFSTPRVGSEASLHEEDKPPIFRCRSSSTSESRSTPGSTNTIARRGSTGTTPPDKLFVLKDLNLRSKFTVGPDRKALLMRQLQFDVEWLEKHNLMDYSFLLGVASSERLDSPFVSAHRHSRTSKSCNNTPDLAMSTGRKSASNLQTPCAPPRDPEVDPGATIPFPQFTPGPKGLLARGDQTCDADTTGSLTPIASVPADAIALAEADVEDEEHEEEDDDPEVDSELGAILRRNKLQRSESAALLPENATANIKLIGHGKAKRSRESSTIFRQSCTTYTFLVTRTSPMTLPGSPNEGAASAKTPDKASNEWIVFRRYKDFEKLQRGLQDELKSANSALKLPPLPRKARIGFMEPEFVRKREKELQNWIQSILSLVGYRVDSPMLHQFLTLKANRCPPKWNAEENLRQLVHRRTSSPIGTSQDSGGDGRSARASPAQASTSASSASHLHGRQQSAARSSSRRDQPKSGRLVNKMHPNSEENATLWESLGGERHQSFGAQKRSVSAKGSSVDQEVQLFVGIIDILQEFNLSKKLESVFKGLTQHADGISAVDPERYGERFLSFVDDFVFE
ncbi:Phosphatidylinositol 4-phosphate 5-kinase type-1 beta (PIP5K1-beta) (PtdIns(4)P-5-kinase 1 beta) (Phosphatidylinositol 4-phosphate 5-kinase type I beta) (PIP5KIbeta) (Type I phosphatidylinositol 4-phosphate 5-kinase beta) [Durusdinium trenchii]|uniref:1-phosphatidylinositol-4-phosphate 5-kinase n=1 Tax=Durusdinium trenchii TaxID=1381693 RepID=A0ABP0RG78_9DINO